MSKAGYLSREYAKQNGTQEHHRKDEKERRKKRRKQALETVKDPTQLIMQLTPRKGRQVIRQLNDTIGMDAYVIVGYKDKENPELVEVEMYVPGKSLAMMLKLTWAGL